MMQQERLTIAVFVDYDNIEIGVKSTLRREFDVSLPLEALKERGDIVAKFAYANWSRQEPATRQMALQTNGRTQRDYHVCRMQQGGERPVLPGQHQAAV